MTSDPTVPGALIASPDGRTVLSIRRYSRRDIVPVEWVWEPRLARGKLTVLSGDPGYGKSTIQTDLMARITTGAAWPDGRGRAPLGAVILLSAEDGPRDTIIPRIVAMGGDPARVNIIEMLSVTRDDGTQEERTFDLTRDLAVLDRAITQLGDVVLVSIDPIDAYLGARTDSHRNASMRGVLAPFTALAEQTRVSMWVTSHLNKTGGKDAPRRALYRTQGSIGLVAAARIAFVVGKHPEHPDPTDQHFVLVHQKNNLAPAPPTLGYAVVARELPELDGAAVGTVVWDAAPVPGVTADSILNASPEKSVPPVQTFLRGLLAQGPISAVQGRTLGKAAGFSEDQLDRARNKLAITAERRGFGKAGEWWWVPPADLAAPRAHAHEYGGDAVYAAYGRSAGLSGWEGRDGGAAYVTDPEAPKTAGEVPIGRDIDREGHGLLERDNNITTSSSLSPIDRAPRVPSRAREEEPTPLAAATELQRPRRTPV